MHRCLSTLSTLSFWPVTSVGERASPGGVPEEKGWQKKSMTPIVGSFRPTGGSHCPVWATVPGRFSYDARSPEGPARPPGEVLSAFLPQLPICPLNWLSVPGRGICRCCLKSLFLERKSLWRGWQIEDGWLEEIEYNKILTMRGFPWWLSGKESTCQCRRHGFDPWSGKILRRRAGTPVRCHLYWICVLEPTSHNYWALLQQLLKLSPPRACALQQEATAVRSLRTATKNSPCSSQPEKSRCSNEDPAQPNINT